MSSLWLTVEVAPGTDIKTACIETVALANLTCLTIWFDFNGVKCLARKGDNPMKIVEHWNEQTASNTEGKYLIAKDRSR